MNAWKSIVIIAGLIGTALTTVAITSCDGPYELVYYPDDDDAGSCEHKDGGAGGGGGSDAGCP
jgi:hypothetical protein